MSNAFDDLLSVQPVEPAPATASAPAMPTPPANEPDGPVPDPTHQDPVPEVTNPEAPEAAPPQTGPEVDPEAPSRTEAGGEPAPTTQPVADPQPDATQPSPAPAAPPKQTSDDRPSRSDSMKRRHRASLDEVFGKPGTHFEVLDEVHLEGEQKFKTPFGNSGRHGWVIREINTGEVHTIGASALKIAINEYKVIDPLPKKARGRKAKDDVEQPAEACPSAATAFLA